MTLREGKFDPPGWFSLAALYSWGKWLIINHDCVYTILEGELDFA